MNDNTRRLIGLLIMLSALSVPLLRADDMPVQALVVPWAPPPSELIELRGQLVHYRDEGPRKDPVPLLMLHGRSSSLHTWDGWVKVLKAQRRVLRVDLPGFGITGPWAGANEGQAYNAETLGRFVLELMDHLQLQRVVLVGHGLGGELAWHLAQQAPQRVDRLVLVAPTGLDVVPEAEPLAWQMARVPVLGRFGEWMLTRGVVRQGLAVAVADPAKITDAQVERYYYLALRTGNRAAGIQELREAPAGQGAAHASGITQPTLLLWGAQDHIVPPAAAARFAADIPGSQRVQWDGLGHLPQEEDPARSVAAVQGFLEGHR